MKLSSDLISQFVEVTNDTPTQNKETVVYGTTVVNSSGIFVRLDGSDILTPVTTTTNVANGERVTVMIKNHTATITGNITSPAARGKDVEMSVNSLNIKIEGAEESANNALTSAGNALNTANSANSAASSAQSTADAANTAAGKAETAAKEAARYATDYLSLSDKGLEIGSNAYNTNVLISSNAIDFRKGNTVLASYEAEYIYLGKASRKATIDIANGVARLYNEDDTDMNYSRLVIGSDHSIKLSSEHGIYQDVSWKDTTHPTGKGQESTAWIHTEAAVPWYETLSVDAEIELGIRNDYPNTWRGEHTIKLDRTRVTLRAEQYDYGVGAYQGSEITLDMDGTIYVFGDILMENSNIILEPTQNIYGRDFNGELVEAMCPYSTYGNLSIGHGLYTRGEGSTNLYGNTINFGIKTAGVSYKPYHEAGDSFSGDWYGSGYITSEGKRVYFSIPVSKPIIGSPTVSVSSVDGLMIRIASGGYGFGSTNSSYAKPSSYSAAVGPGGNYIRVVAIYTNTTNITNNTPCGVAASIKITFS